MSNCDIAVALCSALLFAFVAPAHGADANATTPAANAEPPEAYIAVAGAPGDGEQALGAALGKRLSAAGVKIASGFAANVYSVEGIVKVTVLKGARQNIRIDWTIFAPDGSTLGGVSQTRTVRKGSLDKRWGAAAAAAARAAASEIVKLLPPRPPTPKAP